MYSRTVTARRGHAIGTALGVTLILGAGATSISRPVAAAANRGGPDRVGSWAAPFEEGGAGTPRCARDGGGRLLCKPVGYAQTVTPDGRVFYFNGIESSDNVRYGSAAELSPEARNARARVLDLHSGTPVWSIPGHEDGGARNPNARPGDSCAASDPLGVAGVPGRAGDGLVGSLVGGSLTGTSTGVGRNPTCSPDTGVNNSGDMFCANLATLADGRVMVVGGTSWYNEPGNGIDQAHGYPTDIGAIELEGLRSARMFNPYTNDFDQAAPMKYGRWYPGVVTLADGRVIAMSGVTKLVKSTQASSVRRTETYDPVANAWTENYTGPLSENSLPLMPRVFLTPNNKIFYTGSGQMWGPFGQAADEALFGLQQFFNLDTKRWEITGLNPLGARSGSFTAALPMSPPYDRVTLLTFGGTLGPPPGGELAVPLAQLTTIDRAGNVTNTMAANMHRPRWFGAGVPLPDGKILALNGADKDEVVAPGTEIAIRTPELYDPMNNTWTDMAPESRDRTYHNSAILLPDGRVMSGGHSTIPSLYGAHHTLLPGVTANNDHDPSFQSWSPPYLSYGPRPAITHAQRGVAWGSSFDIGVDDASSIRSIVLMRGAAQQHVIDSNARTLALEFTVTGPHSIRAITPQTGVVAPPGLYYLFVNRQNPGGVTPSVARMVFVGGQSDSTEALQPMADSGTTIHGSATPVVDDSYQSEILALQGHDRTVNARTKPAIDDPRARDSGLRPVASRLTGLGREAGVPGPVPAVAVLTSLSVGLGVRGWLRRRRRLNR